ncbi:cache domain-containing sensor histidine kinase [Paenibacillus harenae]|uniref:cache domain-containing sensor histidine kinase n=1 Tax=Paenibacillus harenae TaxID=306543 RepID=UPI002793D9CF|nr:sensor histidine kinase [Paenibacillus harenae]MDQ0061890.1 two-component system sensor histidine kinase YesM [Paenibacillus harenae]
MRKQFPFISIKAKMSIICLTVVIVPIFVMTVISYASSQRLLEQKYTELLMDIATQTNVSIDEYLKEVEKISLVASFGMNSSVKAAAEDNYPLQEYLRDDNEDNENTAYGMLMNYIMMKDREISFYIYNLNGGQDLFVGTDLPYDYSYKVKEEEWFKFFQVSNSKMMTLDTHVDRQTKSKKLAIAHARKILDMDSGTLLGIMVVRIDLSVIEVVNSRLQQSLRSRFTIVDEADNIIFNANTSLIGKKFSETVRPDKRDHIIVESVFDRQRWTTYLYMPMSELSAEGDILRQNIYLLAILMLLFLVIISIYLSSVITRPIKKLMSNILLVEKGQFEHVEDIHSRDEIGLLSTRFNRMSRELKGLVSQIQQEEMKKAAAEIRALQSQINPHFLYNTLGSVKWIASMQQADTIVVMTEALIAMLRYAARAEGAMVAVREELDNLRNYMTIQQVRYYNRIRMDIFADETLLEQRMPKLILQPIVENAIFHGLAEKEEDGIVTIRIARGENGFIIDVHDNGEGMDEETLRLIKASLAGEADNGESIGLHNVQRRIQLHYGNRYGIECNSAKGAGTTFRIGLPEEENAQEMKHLGA